MIPWSLSSSPYKVQVIGIAFPDSFPANVLPWRRKKAFKAQGLYSLSGRRSYHKSSWGLEATRLNTILFVSRGRRGACQISEQLEKSKPKSCGFDNLQ